MSPGYKSLKAFQAALHRWLRSRTSKELFTFCCFLVLSGVFWLMLSLNETFEQELRVPVRITGVPSNVVLTSNEQDTISVTVSDKGFALWDYLYGSSRPYIEVAFASYNRKNGVGLVAGADLRRLLMRQMQPTTRITAIKPENYHYSYNYGQRRRVPVRYSGRVMADELRFISSVKYSPDSITIYSSNHLLDSVRTVYTEPLNFVGVDDTLHVSTGLQPIADVKMVPDHVEVTFFTDVLTEESIDGIPIQGINLPEGKRLRTFPARVKVRFVAGLSVYRRLKASDFLVVADYKELSADPSEKCRIYLKRAPKGISRPKLDLSEVDYLIEEVAE